MLLFFRLLLLGLWLGICFVFTFFISLFRPCHPRNTYYFGKLIRWGSKPILGIDLEIRNPDRLTKYSSSIYLANHQSNYDIFLYTHLASPGAVTLGKKELLFIPFFGFIYWISGNILIDRGNKRKAMESMEKVRSLIIQKNMKVLIMPEGTRSKSQGLLPFKHGAFYTAIHAGVPIVPICATDWHQFVDLKKWKSGKVIIDMLEPIPTSHLTEIDVPALVEKCHRQMDEKIKELNRELENSELE